MMLFQMAARNQRIRLRVGNAHFETTIGSLTTVPSRIPHLLEQLNNNNDEELTLEGDPAAFRVILNFLRDGEIDLPDERDERAHEWMESILREAERLELTALCDFLLSKWSAVEGGEEAEEEERRRGMRRGARVVWRDINLRRMMSKEASLPVGLSLLDRWCAECESTVAEECIALLDRPRCEIEDCGRIREICGNGRCATVSFGFFRARFHLPLRWLQLIDEGM
ncbi:hypothetical protein PENTCL1PPCAC_9459 [Pristionchus entomophagus]|uniref:Potassium channel tetramerisation-type BTB domain-containing protein n=1 Tax=Pristionchus entomophagus TaxID=358040 RepID=A0AAV5T121_9BILA|nr:hypothetical protein PENTCL1PPCAC_9459 [Pristionchus entomophagus]